MMRVLGSTAVLACIYALALASRDPWDLAIGVVLGLSVSLAFQGFLYSDAGPASRGLAQRISRFPALVAATAVDIVRGTVSVARAVLSTELPKHAGFVSIPKGERSPNGVIVSAWLNTLSPGSVYVGDDLTPDAWTIHALDTSRKADIRADAERFYERYQRPIWP